jgi:hypothetical protein
MGQPEKSRYHSFHILNVKLRKKNSTAELSTQDYVKLFKRVFSKKIHRESSASKHCIFRFMFEEKEKNEVQFLSGTFAQFTFIHNERWFNLNSLDLDEEFKVPDGLFPDAKITEYVFIPQAHRFCYRVSYDFNVSPYPIKKFLEFALNDAALKGQFVQVDVESDRASLDAIFSAREIKKLLIDINYSNTDIGDDLKKFVEDDIKASNTSRLKMEATQKPQVSIDIKQSKILSGAIESSISNGETEATILDENNRVQKIKTTNFPRKESVYGVKSRFNQLVFDRIMSIFRSGNANKKKQKKKPRNGKNKSNKG